MTIIVPAHAGIISCEDVFPKISYEITNGIGKSCVLSTDTKSLIVEFEAKMDGYLDVKIPRNSEADPCNESGLLILLNDEEVDFDQNKSLFSRLIMIPFNENDTKIEIVATHIPEYPHIPKISDCMAEKSPKQQTSSNVVLDKVICNRDFVLLEKESEHSAACVTPSTAKTLVERSWGQYVYSQGSIEVVKDNILHSINYKIKNGTVNDIFVYPDSESLIVDIESTQDGQLIIKIPRTVIDARLGPDGINGEDDSFFVIIDAGEVRFTEEKDESFRELTIPFEANSKKVEIIGTKSMS